MIEDKEDVYDEQIAPLITAIAAICKREGIPMAASFEYAPERYCSTVIPGADAGHMVRRIQEIICAEAVA